MTWFHLSLFTYSSRLHLLNSTVPVFRSFEKFADSLFPPQNEISDIDSAVLSNFARLNSFLWSLSRSTTFPSWKKQSHNLYPTSIFATIYGRPSVTSPALLLAPRTARSFSLLCAANLPSTAFSAARLGRFGREQPVLDRANQLVLDLARKNGFGFV